MCQHLELTAAVKKKDTYPRLWCPAWNPSVLTVENPQIKSGAGSYWLHNSNLRCTPAVLLRHLIQVQPSGSTQVSSQWLSREPEILIQEQWIVPNLEHHPLKVYRGCNGVFWLTMLYSIFLPRQLKCKRIETWNWNNVGKLDKHRNRWDIFLLRGRSLAKGLLCFHGCFYLTRQRKGLAALPEIPALLPAAAKGIKLGQHKLWPRLLVVPSVLKLPHVSVLWSAVGN